MTDVGGLYAVSGAPGSGKSTVLPELVRLLRSTAADTRHVPVAMDIDELLEDGALLGVPIATQDARADWPAYNRLWRRIIDMTRRVGHPVLLLSPLVPSEFDGVTSWALLDCADDVRLARLRSRGWPADQIDYAISDAREYRALFSTVIRTDDADPAEIAGRILQWVS